MGEGDPFSLGDSDQEKDAKHDTEGGKYTAEAVAGEGSSGK